MPAKDAAQWKRYADRRTPTHSLPASSKPPCDLSWSECVACIVQALPALTFLHVSPGRGSKPCGTARTTEELRAEHHLLLNLLDHLNEVRTVQIAIPEKFESCPGLCSAVAQTSCLPGRCTAATATLRRCTIVNSTRARSRWCARHPRTMRLERASPRPRASLLCNFAALSPN